LVAKVDATFTRGDDGRPQDLGPGLYGPSLFYRAIGDFHFLHVCNHWVADVLDAAGVPTSPVLAILPQGLFLDLSMRHRPYSAAVTAINPKIRIPMPDLRLTLACWDYDRSVR